MSESTASTSTINRMRSTPSREMDSSDDDDDSSIKVNHPRRPRCPPLHIDLPLQSAHDSSPIRRIHSSKSLHALELDLEGVVSRRCSYVQSRSQSFGSSLQMDDNDSTASPPVVTLSPVDIDVSPQPSEAFAPREIT
jgi:hypothetical protein